MDLPGNKKSPGTHFITVGAWAFCHFCICFSVFVNAKPAAPPVSAQPACCRPGFRGIPSTFGWGKQSTWLTANGSLAHLRAQPAPTPGGEPDDHGKAPCRGRVGPVCWFRGRGGGGGSCRGYLDSVGPRVGRRLSGPFKFRERTPPWAPFRAVWGRPIFVLG